MTAPVRKAAQVDEFIASPIKGVNVDGWPIVVVKLGDDFYALEDNCPHERCLLSEGDIDYDGLVCPCHGSVINVRTGRVETGPAIVGSQIDTYQLRIDGNDILLVWG